MSKEFEVVYGHDNILGVDVVFVQEVGKVEQAGEGEQAEARARSYGGGSEESGEAGVPQRSIRVSPRSMPQRTFYRSARLRADPTPDLARLTRLIPEAATADERPEILYELIVDRYGV